MRSIAAGLFLGALGLHLLPWLPDVSWAWLLPAGCVGLFIPLFRIPAACVCGFLWALVTANTTLSAQLPVALEKKDLVVTGTVVGLPDEGQRRTRFDFKAATARLDGQPVALGPVTIRLSWYGAEPVAPGERWRLTVRLTRPHGFYNPGGFDYEGWLFRQRISATGYVRQAPTGERLATSPAWGIDYWRFRIASYMDAQLADEDVKGLIMALGVGDRQAITDEQWQVLRKTGTNHLMAISGLHIGLVAWMAYTAFFWCWTRCGNAALRYPAPKAASLVAVSAAVVYAALAGFSIPTQRALVMVCIVVGSVYLRRELPFSTVLALALIVVLLVDPHAVSDLGFFLSFTAVAIIGYVVVGRLRPAGRWKQVLHVQLVISAVMLPLLLWFFSGVSLTSPVANLVAIPWVSFTVVPLVLWSIVFAPVSDFLATGLLILATTSLSWLWWGLEALSQWEPGYWQIPHPPIGMALAAMAGMVLLMAPKAVPARWLGLFGLAPLLFHQPIRPAIGEAHFTLLDVGQGLAAVVKTRNHVMVFDTGPRFSDRFDAGAAVVGPFLRHHGVDMIDLLVVSHGDNDHIGGMVSLLDEFPVKKIVTSVPKLLGVAGDVCRRPMRWHWDGIDIHLLHPGRQRWDSENNGSCVMQIIAGEERILIGADIEKEAETALVQRFGERLRSDILIAPHHGSATSSSSAFIAAVAPSHVFFPAGYRNRFGHPHPDVAARYRRQGVATYQTGHLGALSVTLGRRPSGIDEITWYRREKARFWLSTVSDN